MSNLIYTMRKILHGFIGFITLTGALLLSVSTCFAAEELRIAGQLVEKSNASDLKSLSGVTVGAEGEFTYDFDKKILTMKRVTIEASSYYAISSNIKDLKIVVLASNTLKGNPMVMKLEEDTEIKTEASNEGTLNIKSTSEAGLFAKKRVEISDITLNIEGSQGIAGKTDATQVVFKNLTGKITGSEAAINEIKELRLYRTHFPSPANATFKAEKYGVVNEENKFVKELTLAPSLGFSIAGTEITRDNYNKLDQIPGVKVLDGGYLTFDPNQDIWHQSLKMKDVEINGG